VKEGNTMMWTTEMQNDGRKKARCQWEAVERSRLQSIEHWPDSPSKQALITAIQASLASLTQFPAGSPAYYPSCLPAFSMSIS
jgi:hypothetical protein